MPTRRLCAYCAVAPATTKDHIPPQTLFMGVKNPQLITVPSCKACNEGASLDDENFRDKLALRFELSDEPLAQPMIAAYLRKMELERVRGQLATTLESFHPVELHSPAGLYLGTARGLTVDMTRIERVLMRMVAGLYYRERRVSLPADYRAYGFDITHPDPEQLEHLRMHFGRREPTKVGGQVFEYVQVAANDNADVTEWLFYFYRRRVAFLGFTFPAALGSPHGVEALA